MGVPKNVLEQAEADDRAIDEVMQNHDASPSRVIAEPSSPDAEGKPTAHQNERRKSEERVNPADAGSLLAELERERQLRKTLEGRLNSQLKPANEEIRRLRQELEENEKKIRAMEQASKKPGAERFITDKEKEELGEVLDLNSRMIKGILEEELENKGVTAVVEKVMQQSNRARTQQAAAGGPSADFWPIVDQYCPGSRAINRNNDRRWLEYLDLYDARTGQKHRDAAEQAMRDDDPKALADMFADFMRKNGIVSGAAGDAAEFEERSPKPERGGGRQILRNPGPPGVVPWTKAEVNAFYTDVSKGKFKGREAEQQKLEAEIMAAAQAGAIT